MADAIVSFTVERLGDLLISEAKLLYVVSDQINEIRCELKRMQNFLKEADKKQNQDERVRGWVHEIKELAFRTEDAVEIFALQVATNSGYKEALRRFACISVQVKSRHYVAMEINDIKATLTNIHQSVPTYGITKGLEEGETSNSQVNPKTERVSFPRDVEKDFIGMEKEIEQLISHLKNEDKGCEVVSIWGMGGQGKTTLAQKLYNHAVIRDHFKAFAWVCISQQFNLEKVLKGILKQLLPDGRQGEVSYMDDGELVDELRKIQQEKKCFIVIDDIWTVDSWRLIKPAFLLGGETTSGCKILLTTREKKVQAKIGSVCEIPCLTEDEGWHLLSKKSRINDHPDIKVDSEIEKIGRKMVKSCKGLPLAISTLGGILKGKHLLREWEKINTDISFYLANGTNDDDEYYMVRQVLGLSYDNLPSRLRHCFLCFANYREDEIIETGKLYMFWIAEGLISVEDKAQGEMMLDVAERYLDELVDRSLVRIETHNDEGKSWSKYGTCVVHDLIQDLCFSKVKEEGVINVIDLERKRDIKSKASTVRRLCVRSISYDANRDVLEPYDPHVILHVRSLFFWNERDDSDVVWPGKILDLEKFKLLRVLTARGFIFSKQNMRSISELVYLKYLCLRGCQLNYLPSSIGKLRNLETLDVRNFLMYLSIPNVVWKLKKLKHLYLPVDFFVRGRAKKLRLEGLNELELIFNFDSEYCDAHDLFGLLNLKIFQGYIRVQENLTAENIIDFFKSRELRWTRVTLILGEEQVTSMDLVLECFIDELTIYGKCVLFPMVSDYTRFSGRLTQLRLNHIETEEDPMILLGELGNLRILSFYVANFLEGEIVCLAMSFPKLEKLNFEQVKGLRGWRVEEGAMPNLSELLIRHSAELEMLPAGLISLTSLKLLSIEYMPTTFTDKIMAVDGTEGPDFYKVRHIPNLYITL